MGILNKLRGGSGGKLAPRLKQAERLLDGGKLDEAVELLDKLAAERTESTPAGEVRELSRLRRAAFNNLLQEGLTERALAHAEMLAAGDRESLIYVAEKLVDGQLLDPRALKLISTAAQGGDRERRLLLAEAKLILTRRGDQMAGAELEFVTEAAKAFPLWKDGLSVLADMYLKDGRRDNEALTVYRNAYPNRKADRRLREVLLESLIANEQHDEFAASVYRDAVETSSSPQALRLLAEYYIEKGEFVPQTIYYIQRALETSKLSPEALKKVAEIALVAQGVSFDRLALCTAVYRQGFSDRNLLAFMAEQLAQANRFDAEAIEIMTRAFELRMVSKRAILILTEHCLANDREDDFALRVYESYLSTWPDRPQRRIYYILAHHYASLTRVDEQAQKIYEEALVENQTDTEIITILARAYHASARRDDAAEQVYRHAFPLAGGAVKVELATILAEMKLASGDFNEDTLQYLTVMGRPESGPLKDRYDEALTNCFLATGRRGEQAQQAYFALFERTEYSPDLSMRLVALLAEIIRERPAPPVPDSLEMRVYRRLFEMQKFSTDPEISFVLLDEALSALKPQVNLLNLAVRCFEADMARFVEALKKHHREKLLAEVGGFFIEHYNFQQAALAFEASYEIAPSEEINYQLTKLHLLEERPTHALEHLALVTSPQYVTKRIYWEAAAYQQMGQPEHAAELLAKIVADGEVPEFLLKLRQGLNLELSNSLEASLKIYDELAGAREYPQFERWVQLERGIVLMKLKRWEQARNHLEEVLRHNPNGRAEQLFLSLALFFLAREFMHSDSIDLALPLFTRAVEVNRNHRLLRQVIVEVLSLFGERAFFDGKLDRAARILEVAHRILPKRAETKTYLAYTYHRLQDYAKAIIYYRDISWSDENPRLELSQAYAYIAHRQPEKAWKVYLDLTRRGNLPLDNFPRLVACFLADAEATGGKSWKKVEFPEGVDGLLLGALLIHDGQYERAAEALEQLVKDEPANLQMRWYVGRAYAQMGKRDMAVHNWRNLLALCLTAEASPETKIRQLSEIGLAFLGAGYAHEAMQTWEELRKLDDKNPDLPVLYAATLDLNAYQLARKDQHKLAREEWKKALSYTPDNTTILQNFGICCLLLDDYEEATRQFQRLSQLWAGMMRKDPRTYGIYSKYIGALERAMNTLALTKGRPEFDLTKVRAEDAIDYYQKANQFYWILSLDKRATQLQIEHEYFRLIKIFNPERHADDFMLVEESYTNLFKDPERRAIIDLFVFNPLDISTVRQKLSHLPKTGEVSFEQLRLPVSLPPPDFQQLKPIKATDDELSGPLIELLEINFKMPDWMML